MESVNKAHKNKQYITSAVHYVSLALFLILQVAAIIVTFSLFRRYFARFYIILELISLCVVLYIVREDSNPSYKIPWIILNLALPILGGLSYLMFGRVRFTRDEKRRAAEIRKRYVRAMFGERDAMDELKEENPDMALQAQYIRNNADAPVFKNTQVTYFPLGEDMVEQMIPALERAERFIFIEYFIINPGALWNQIEDILEQKAATGVDVRVIYDAVGSIGLVPADFVRKLERKGIRALMFNPLTNIFSSRFNNRDHRKICVVDGNIGFTGGMNLADEYINAIDRYGHWKDTNVMLRGAGVWSLTAMFLTLWNFETRGDDRFAQFKPTLSVDAPGYVQPYTDNPNDAELVGQTVYMNMINRARRYVYITTPYLIIDSEMISALSIAAKSGVDVRIITPGVPDKKIAYALTRSYYDVLLRAGVRIYEYTPGFMHAKQFVSDDRCAVVGTINLDYRSLCHHYECAVWMCDTPVILEIKADMLDAIARSREITLAICRGRPILMRLALPVLRLFAPLF
ncbi:MAG: cardiolipin synthase [Christensenellales bacterium]|jgi:cardiolipin synthase